MGRKRGKKNFTDTTTFKLCLHTKKSDEESNFEDNNDFSINSASSLDNDMCPELKQAIESGKWLRSDTESCQLSSRMDPTRGNGNTKHAGCITRPLKSLNVPSCGIKMQVLMDLQG